MVPLRPDLSLALDALRPVNDHTVARAAVTGRDLLGPGERRVAGHGPPCGIVTVGLRPAEFVVVLQNVLDRLLHTVEVGHLVEHAVHAALGARPVVSEDVEDQRVVELAHVRDRVDEPPDLVVCLLGKACEDLHLAGKELLFLRAQPVPVLDGRWLGRERRARGHDAHLDLAGKRLFPQPVPPTVELAPVPGDPLLGHLVRRVGCARRKVDEEGLVRRQGLDRSHPVDRLVGHIGREVVVRVLRHLYLCHPVINGRRPLVRLPAHEAVELIEAVARRPAIRRSGRADLPGGGFVILAEMRRRVAVVPQHHGKRRHALGTLPGVSRKRRRGLHDGSRVVRVVIAPRQEGCPRRRAQCRRVELVVLEAALRQTFRRRHVDRPPEGAGLSEPHVVDQDNENVWGLCRRFDLESRRGCRIPDIEDGAVRVLRLPDRKRCAVQRRLRRGRCRAGGRQGNTDRQVYGISFHVPAPFSIVIASCLFQPALFDDRGRRGSPGEGRRWDPVTPLR